MAIRYAPVILLLLLIAGPAKAQDEAGIIGLVTDESGAVLPGVTVTVTGPALQVPSMVAVTDARGAYRVTPLPIGTYTVEYALSGFQAVRREGIRLTVGFTASVDVALKVGSLEETITVSGASPVVDTKSTTTTTQLTRETIELLPSSRNGVVSLLSQAPGVRTLRDVGGSSLNSVPTFRVFGQAGEAFSTLEGVWTSSLQQSSGQANYWDYTSLEEASVKTIGNGADVPSRGVNLTAVVKSGGNDFHGSGWVNDSGKKFQSNNIDAALKTQGITSPDAVDQRYSFSGDLGGRIIKDKLWFYGSARRQTDNHFPLNTFLADGVTPAVAVSYAWFHTEKASYQMSSSNRLVGFWMHNHKYLTSGLSQFQPYRDRSGLTTFSDTRKIEWQKTWGNTLVTSVQVGGFQYHDHQGWTFAPRDEVPTLNQTTQLTSGPPLNTGERPIVPRQHVKAVMTWYRPDLFAGSHELKFGFDYANANYGRQYPLVDPNAKEPDGAWSSYVYDYQLIFQGVNNTPAQLVVQNLPAHAWVVSHYASFYGQDSWTVGRRLTLNLGLRYAHDNGYVPASCRDAALPPADVAFPATCFAKQQFNIWNVWAPRLYASYDVSGNGKTVIKGGWGRFNHERQQVPELDSADPQVRSQATYTWHDLNNDKAYQPGEVNLSTTGTDFLSQSGGSNNVPNPNEKDPKSDEVSVSIERELFANFALRVSGVYSRTESYRIANNLRPYSTYNIPITNPDPGPDGIIGTADDPGTQITYYEYPSSLAGRPFEQFTLTNDYNATQSFKSLEIGAFKRFSKKWEFLASYSATKRNVPVSPVLVQNALVSASSGEFNSNTLVGDLNPNAEINTSDHTWEWTGKASGAYTLPFDLLVSANYERRGGLPWARQVLFSKNLPGVVNVGKTITSITLNVEPIGTRRFPDTNQVDLRLEKSLRLKKGQKVSIRMNIFNLFNINTVTNATKLSASGATPFNTPTAIIAPRIVEFSGSYQF